MMIAADYDESGRIHSVTHGPLCVFENMPRKIECDPYVSDDTHYVDLKGEPSIEVKKPIKPLVEATGLFAVLSGIPAGSTVSVGNISDVVDDGELTIEFDLPGTYSIEINPPPQFLDETLEVTVGNP